MITKLILKGGVVGWEIRDNNRREAEIVGRDKKKRMNIVIVNMFNIMNIVNIFIVNMLNILNILNILIAKI